LIAAQCAAAPVARRKSIDHIPGGYAAGAAYAALIKRFNRFIRDSYKMKKRLSNPESRFFYQKRR